MRARVSIVAAAVLLTAAVSVGCSNIADSPDASLQSKLTPLGPPPPLRPELADKRNGRRDPDVLV